MVSSTYLDKARNSYVRVLDDLFIILWRLQLQIRNTYEMGDALSYMAMLRV
jgi:hypothetical protein